MLHSTVLKDILWIEASIQNSEKTENKAVESVNELKFAANFYIRMYQIFVSSQQFEDKVCTFEPSCSYFSQDAFKKYGFMKGFLMTGDRLQRCHSANTEYYFRNPKTGRLIDPTEDHE
jgi:putative component of membrane protein insertase Oxa1/YidC/SpoIIIJ protein YidD